MVLSRYFRLLNILFLSSVVFSGLSDAATPANPQLAMDGGMAHLFNRLAGPQSKKLQDTQAILNTVQALSMLESLPGITLSDADKASKNEAIVTVTKSLCKELRQINSRSAKLGYAIAVGLAGAEKGIDAVDTVFEGVETGVAMRLASECGNILSKRIGGTAEHVLGGTWDFVVGTIIDLWQTAQNIIFHGDNEPFTTKELRGWQTHFKICFDDIERLVKDGVKDSLRAQDMSLRKPEDAADGADDVAVLQKVRAKGWVNLRDAYIRQTNYFIMLLDKRVGYYDAEDAVTFYAGELKLCLLDILTLFLECPTIKELDAALDSSKYLIPAHRKNIDSLMIRLIEWVEPKSYSLIRDSGSSSRDTSTRKESSSSGMDEEAYPRPMGGGWG